MTLCRIIKCWWPASHPYPKRTILLFGGIIELSRHFPCAWDAFSLDVGTRRAFVCLSPHGPLAIGDGFREVGFWWALRSPITYICIHAGFIGLLSICLDAEGRARALDALLRAEVQ